ncbi:hypothetical protein FQN50_009110 [Emmonsiellopsis sp. PD_5]|nr:hypothetical protein FQN50_009110 [Emmonsiellopsis sp. PD_5]
MAEPKMRLEDWLDDLCVRFIINLPREELESVERICFQVEEAQWFYEDFIRPLDPNLPSLSLRAFALRIFQHCPLMSQWSHYHHSTAFSEFLAYKTRVPVRGAILLNQDMDEVVLVKGWKKNANWSFPRGKINKDEKDLDCAIREVYEETGFDIREAGLVKDEKKMKYIEIPMREQNMRLYVLRGVRMDTNFEPRTRKEISKIQWYKLSELPTLRKSKQNETDGHNLSNKFYMVAPFLVPLKKWIAQQKRADLAAAQNPNSNGDGLLVEESEGLAGNESPPKEAASEAQRPSDLPEVSMVDNPSDHLKRLLNISNSSSLPEVSPRNQPQLPNPDLSKGSALLALLRKGSDTGVSQAPEPTPTQSAQSIFPTKGMQGPPQNTSQHTSIPHSSFTQPPVSHHPGFPPMRAGPGMPMNQPPFRPMPHPGQAGHYPLPHFPYPPGHPFHQRQPPPHSTPREFPHLSFPKPPPGSYPQAQQSMFSNPPGQPLGASAAPAPGPRPSFATNLPQRNTPAPYQRTGDPEFAQAPLFPNLHVPSVPPASKLPPPKLTSHSLALLNVFKNENIKKADTTKPESMPQPRAEQPTTKVPSQHRDSLLDLLKKSPVATSAPTAVHSVPPGHAELAARPSPTLNTANIHAPGASANHKQKVQIQSRKSPDKNASTSATVSGPLNMPQFEAIAKSVPKRYPSQGPRNTVKKEATPPKTNFVILPRPSSASKKEASPSPAPKAPEVPVSPPRRNVRISEITKPFQPKILRRPAKEDFEASLPTGTVAVSSFSLPGKDTGAERQRGQPVEANYNRRPSQTTQQKETLLSLFGKSPTSPALQSTEIKRPSSPVSKSPPRSDVISPLSAPSPQPAASKPEPVSLSSVGSVSPVAGSDSQKGGQTSPIDKAFLLGYLDGVAKGKR